jgi:hypothetical protein
VPDSATPLQTGAPTVMMGVCSPSAGANALTLHISYITFFNAKAAAWLLTQIAAPIKEQGHDAGNMTPSGGAVISGGCRA